jgi:hypothetical protein
MASNMAACVLGGVRLISSGWIMLAKMAPFKSETAVRCRWVLHYFGSVMSLGSSRRELIRLKAGAAFAPASRLTVS